MDRQQLLRQSSWAFIAGVERHQRIKLQRDMWKLCSENRALGGRYWRTVLKRFGLKESELWTNVAGESQTPRGGTNA